MPTTNTRTVKASGGDYTSWSAWEAGRQADLVAGDIIERCELYDLGAADTAVVSINGWTTDSTRYIECVVPVAERHDGKRSTSKYRLHVSTGGNALSISEDNVRIQGVQVKNTHTSGDACVLINPTDGTVDIRIVDCLAYDIAGAGADGTGFMVFKGNGVKFLNCAALNCQAGSGVYRTGFYLYPLGTGNTFTAINCVAMGCGYGFRADSRTITAINCYAGGSTVGDDYSSNFGTFVLTTCYSEDGTQSTSTAAYSTSSGAYFTNVTAGSEDPHIGASSTLIGAGTDSPSGWNHPDGDVDIDGDARADWDVGVDEYVSVGGGGQPPRSMHQFRQRA